MNTFKEQQQRSEEEDRKNRFSGNGTNGSDNHRERAASQPPHSSQQGFMGSPNVASSMGAGAPWPTSRSSSRFLSPARGLGSRSSSFSTGNNPSQQRDFGYAMRESSIFDSTFEDEETDELDTYNERYLPPSMSRGRSYQSEISRSRSQSLATGHGSAFNSVVGSPGMGSWNDSFTSPLNIPGGASRYGEIGKPPGSSRYGSLGTVGRSPTAIHSSSPSGTPIMPNGFSRSDITNMSPFVRDVGQILLDDGSAFRELWAGMHPPRDEVNGGGGSGTTSRRHSVSVVQPRRGNIVGFNAPGVSDGPDDVPRSFAGGGGFGGGLMLSDDDLAADLGMLDLNGPPKASQQPPSQPASMPVYTPISRSPPSQDHYQPMNIGSLSSHNGDLHRDPSPPQHQEQAHDLQPRFIPGQGIQYLSQQAIQQDQNAQYARTRRPSYTGGPLSPTSQRMVQNPQSPPYYPTRRPSDAQAPPPPQQLTDLGKGVPLHAVPPSWPLFIVEFKAGRTDLFYLTDTSQDIRVGDLVVVEADRGKDLGKVVNDSITIAEVEAWQTRQQGGANSGAENPTSPGGPPSSSKKEINPKMMYGKASVQDTQQLQQKLQDELKALQLCQTKVRAKKLPMEVIDAEYQWDRRKLTFYFIAEKRIDFRELVRELFRLYKTRIWMASLQGGVSFEQ